MNVNGLLTKCWLSHLESNQNSGYQKPVCSRYTMGQAESRILYHISFAHRPVRMQLMRCGFLMLICITSCGLLRRNGARPREMADSRVLATARHIHICLRVAGLRDSSHFRGFRPAVGGEASRAVHPRELGKRHMRSSLASGKSATPPARCIHRPQRDTSSAEYRLLVSHASAGASRELSSRRSPALAPHTYAVSPTFRYGAFVFVVFALADLSSARLATCGRDHNSARCQSDADRL